MLTSSHFPQPSQRLRDLSFSYDPFAWQHAENITSDVLEEIYTPPPRLHNSIVNPSKSSVLLAQPGSGKTVERLMLSTLLRNQQMNEVKRHLLQKNHASTIPLVIQYDDFEGIIGQVSVSPIEHHIELHVPLLLSRIANSIFEFINSYQELYNNLTVQDQNFWWAFINKYRTGESLSYLIKHDHLLTDWKRNADNPPPLVEGTGLAETLRILISRLNSLKIDSLFILVDGIDAQVQDKSVMELIPFPLLNHLGLFSVNGIIWRFFLPLNLEGMVRKCNAFQRNRLDVATIKWDKKSLSKFLSNQLYWASDGKISNVTSQCSQELITKLSQVDIDASNKDDVDTNLAELALRHARLGPPRALLQLVAKLYHQGNQLQISIDDWNDFILGIQDELLNEAYVKTAYETMIVSVLDDTSKAMGTAFITRHGNKDFIVTCAHVIKELGKKENDTLRLGKMKSDTEFSGKVVWFRPIEEKNDRDWSAIEDVCILEPLSDLGDTEPLPLKIIDKEKYAGLLNCWCFGYLVGTGSRGAQFEEISCKETLQGAGFVALEQSGKEKIGRGVSGAPVYSPDIPGIIGIIQSISGSDTAYLIPSYVIHNIIENIIRSSITGGTI